MLTGPISLRKKPRIICVMSMSAISVELIIVDQFQLLEVENIQLV